MSEATPSNPAATAAPAIPVHVSPVAHAVEAVKAEAAKVETAVVTEAEKVGHSLASAVQTAATVSRKEFNSFLEEFDAFVAKAEAIWQRYGHTL